jgi:hypothetical protein
MRTKMVLKTLVPFIHLTRLIAQEDFIGVTTEACMSMQYKSQMSKCCNMSGESTYVWKKGGKLINILDYFLI